MLVDYFLSRVAASLGQRPKTIAKESLDI